VAQRRLAGTPLDFGGLRTDLGVPGEFSPAAQKEAQQAAESPYLPDLDRTDIEFINVDPAGSKDLDQALHIARDGDAFLVSYAIADVGSFVTPAGTLDTEVRQRGETFYFPDARVPLHPTVMSEGAASLLPNQVTPSVLWQICIDSQGNVTSVRVQRARVKSREQWDYVALQKACDAGSAPTAVQPLLEVGALRQQLARQRHALSLDLPEQEVVKRDDGGWGLTFRAPLPVEDANAEISLLTGMCAAQLMLDGGIGILRTLPPPDPGAIKALRKIAPALDVNWPEGAAPSEVLATLDPSNPKHAAFIDHTSSLLRGAAYAAFDGTPPSQREHSGIGAPYAHVTAPLRRLVDRFGSEVCLALHAKQDVPVWVREALPDLPKLMESADRLAHQVDRAVVDATEAFLLSGRIGEQFTAVVLAADDKSGTIALDDPAVRAKCDGANLPVGQRITVTLRAADPATRSVPFEAATNC
jgi:exoribonuclease R